MFCNACGAELRTSDRYCPGCGKRAGTPVEPRSRGALMLDKKHKKIAGVCAGFAQYLDADVTLVRIVFLVLAFASGIGLVAYVVAWIVMPVDRDSQACGAGEVVRQT